MKRLIMAIQAVAFATITGLVIGGCVHRADPGTVVVRIGQVKDESETVIACPDDGVHFNVNGDCVDTGYHEK